MRKFWYFVLLISILITLFSCSNKNQWILESPNGMLEIDVINFCKPEGLTYSVIYYSKDRIIRAIDTGKLGIEREDAKFLNLEFLSLRKEKGIIDNYELITGKKLKIQSVYNEYILSFRNEEGSLLNLIFRVYNDAIAFRYQFPESSHKQYRVISERTSFNLREGVAWLHPYDALTKWSPAYETYCEIEVPIGKEAPYNSSGWAFPLLFRTDSLWVFISESGFDGYYGSSHLNSNCNDGEYSIKFAEQDEANKYFECNQFNYLPWKTPWRFIVISHDISTIVESNMVTNLAEPNEIKDVSWIKPGKSSWSWWSDNSSPQCIDSLIPFINLAYEMDWDYSLIDANWNRMNKGDLDSLIQYANNKGIGLFLWYNSGGKHNIINEEPRDIISQKRQRRIEFERISKLGVKGVKIDFFLSDKQPIIQQYINILKDASDYNLLVNFHGCTLPKGWRRTFPNLLTMEAIKGYEGYLFDLHFTEKSPANISTIPFLRNVVGPTDFTPGAFSNNRNGYLTSHGFEVALPIIIESGILHYVFNPSIKDSLPDYIIHFLKEVPVTWDETKFLQGYPGKDVVIARKKGKTWYVGGINAEEHPKVFNLDLTELNAARKTVQIISDGDSIHKTNNILTTLGEKKNIKLSTLGRGGFVLIIR